MAFCSLVAGNRACCTSGKQRAEDRGAEHEAGHELSHHRGLPHPQQDFAQQPADHHQRDKLNDEDRLGSGRGAGCSAAERGHRRQQQQGRGCRNPARRSPFIGRGLEVNAAACELGPRPKERGTLKLPTTGRWRLVPSECNCKLFATRLSLLHPKPFGARPCWFPRPRLPLRPSPLFPAAGAAPASGHRWRRYSASIAVRPTGSFWRKLTSFLGPGLSGRGRLHGPRQLGDVARRRLEVRLRAADRCAAVQSDGDPAAGLVRAAWHRRRPRSGAGLPRRVSTRGRRGRSGCLRRSRSAPRISPR